MSQQLQITGGAKVRDLQDVIIGTSGVLSSLAFNVANGVPKLDVNGKILVSQLPNSVMEYLGTWDASTNTPTLVNGTGNQGDVYLCNVAGTTNFGAGPITFAVGDSAIYSGTIWQKAGGATGTVTSVGLTSTGNDAITITGSPITTSGNINLGFAGTNLQYINGAGDLTTFPTLISSIGLSMPSAFSVANSPLTANGTIAVTGAGYPSQYIRGDGTLADFPTSGGGGSSVSYYLNGGTSQGTIGGVTYYEMSKTADTGTMADFSLTGDGFIVAFLTDAGDPAQLNIPAGNWNYEIYASMSANGGTPQMYAELYVYDGTTFTLISTSTNEILYDGTNLNLYSFGMTVPATILTLTDRLAIKLYATNSGGKTTTVHTQDSHLCQIITTFSTGITALNGLTAQVQYFATGTSGTDFNISSATATHTFNLPVASASNTGKLSSTDWSTFNGKVPYTGATANVDLGDYSIKVNGILAYGASGSGGLIGFRQTGTLAGVATGSAYIGSVSAGKLNIYFGDAGLEAAILDNSLLTADRTYNFPDASGTLALLSADQTFTGINSFDYGINYKTGASLANVSGYISQAYAKSGTGAGSTLSLKISDGNSVKAINLDFVGSPATYTYTFPAASGTLALLESTQTFTGVNTFSGLTSFTFSSGTRMDYGPYLTKGSVPSAFSGSTTNIYSDATTNNIVIRDTSSIAKLEFNNSTQTFTFPAASGTIALTSNLSSYLPLAGGIMTGSILLNNNLTISGQLFGTNSYASMLAMSPSDKVLIDNSGRGVIFGGTIGQGAYIYNFPSASGTIALTSNLSSYVPYTGATTNVDLGNNYLISTNVVSTSMIITTGTNNVGGVKMANLTTITLGGSGGDNTRILPSSSERSIFFDQGYISGGSTFNKVFKFDLSSLTNATTRTYTLPDASGTIALTSNITSAISGTTNYHAKFTGTNTIGNSLIWDNGTNVGIGNTNTSYTLDVSGTGRFSGTATFSSIIYGSNGNLDPTAGTNAGTTLALNGNSAANNYSIGLAAIRNSAYDMFFQTGATNGGGYRWYIGTSEKMTMSSTGNIGIGTSSPFAGGNPAKLQVKTATDINLAIQTGTADATGVKLNAFNDAASVNIPMELNGSIMILKTGETERMRITSGGIVLIGLTSTGAYLDGQINASVPSGTPPAACFKNLTSGQFVSSFWNADTTGDNIFIKFVTESSPTVRGTIFYSRSNGVTRFDGQASGTYSDERLKDIKGEMTYGLETINKIKTYDFNWKRNGNKGFGVKAQEICELIPEIVEKGNDDEIDPMEFQTTDIWKVNYNELVPILVKAIQEQQIQIQNLQEQINILAK